MPWGRGVPKTRKPVFVSSNENDLLFLSGVTDIGLGKEWTFLPDGINDAQPLGTSLNQHSLPLMNNE